ncbi:MAG: NrfD/PsrC family molybdoenzyme membrane anchor subunit [Peptococcaceae bacterium]
MLMTASLLVIIGGISVYREISKKQTFTDITNEVPWGIYVVAYFYLAGIGGGLLLLSAAGGLLVPGIAGVTAQLALGFFVGAGFSLLLDLGRPERALKILYMKKQSPMFWDFIGLTVGLGGAALLFIWQPRAESAFFARMVIGLLSCVMVFAAEGWTLNLCPGRGIWNEPLITVVFILEGFASALALLLFFREGPPGVIANGLLAVMTAVLILNFWQFSGKYFLPREPGRRNRKQEVKGVLPLRIAACALLLIAGGKGWILLAAILVLAAGFLEKFEQVLIPQILMAYGQGNEYKHAPKYKLEANKGLIVAGLFGIAGLTYEMLNLLLPLLTG